MNFLDTPVGRDFYRMFNAISDIDTTHALYMMEVFEVMEMMQMFDDAKDMTEEQRKQGINIIRARAISLKDRPEFEALIRISPDYDFDFLPALIKDWAKR